MGLFEKLFGKKKPSPAEKVVPPPLPPAGPPPLPPADPSPDADMITLHDDYGREVRITRDKWRNSVLPNNIQRVWGQPDELYELIVSALRDGFGSDVVKAAEHLYQIDPQPTRGTCIWGIVLNGELRYAEAESVFQQHLARHGEDGAILTNLAKVYSNQSNEAKAEATLWRALEVEPNLDNGLAWYEVMHRERGGEEASLAALRRVAAIPGSWRAQLWLARAALRRRDLSAALDFYREALSRVQPAPGDALMQISGDLGNAGHLVEAIEIVAPRFDAAIHGLAVGNNLIKSHLDLGQLDAARRIIDQLYAQGRPDWKNTLSFWETEIARARVGITPPVKSEKVQVVMLPIDGPVWLKTTSPAAELFPAKDADALRIAVLGGTAEVPPDSPTEEHQLADLRGCLSRAVPLFFAEQIEFGTSARSQTLVARLDHDSRSFLLSTRPWSGEQAVASARQVEPPNDYIICCHLQTGDGPWSVLIRLFRTIDGTCLVTAEAPLSPSEIPESLRELAAKIASCLEGEASFTRQPLPPAYDIPSGEEFGFYLLRLEQLLAVRCAALDVSQGREGFVHNEREILEANLRLCLASPRSAAVRALMAQTFSTMKLIRPEILPEFKDRLEMLRREHPLDGSAHGVVQRIIDEALGA